MVKLTYSESPHVATPHNRLTTDLSPGESVMPFREYDDLLAALIAACPHRGDTVIALGLVTPETAIAIDRAHHRLEEHPGVSPFAGEVEPILPHLTAGTACLYLSNPNRVTGAAYSLTDIETLANAIPYGTLIVDESMPDHFGLTARTMIADHQNIVVLKCRGGSSGQMFGPASLRNRLDRADFAVSPAESITPQVALPADQVTFTHNEALRVAEGLSTLGIQTRLSATDFVLIRVFDPTSVGNALARARVPFENLHGYPGLAHYLKYRIGSFDANSRLLDAFARMPLSWHRMSRRDSRITTLRQKADERITVYEVPEYDIPRSARKLVDTRTP